MGLAQSVVEAVAFQPPRPKIPLASSNVRQYETRASHSTIPLFAVHASSTSDLEDASASAAAAHVVEADTSDTRTWILLSHGTSDDCASSLSFAQYIVSTFDVNVLLYEYPGYGTSRLTTNAEMMETPSEQATLDAVEAAYDFLSGTLHVDSSRVVAMGWSLGSGPTMHLATSRPISGVILQSAFRSVIRVKIPTPWSMRCDVFANEDRAREMPKDVRTLVLHGTEDAVVPFDHGKTLHDIFVQKGNATPDSGVWMKGRGHNDVLKSRAVYEGAIRNFLETVRQSASGFEPPASPLTRVQGLEMNSDDDKKA